MICKLDDEVISTEFGVNCRPDERSPISTDGCLPLTTLYESLTYENERPVLGFNTSDLLVHHKRPDEIHLSRKSSK